MGVPHPVEGMMIAAHIHYDIVHVLYAASRIVAEGNPSAAWSQVAQSIDRWRGTDVADAIRPLIDLAENEESPSCRDIAVAVHAAIPQLSPHVTDIERRLLATAHTRLEELIGPSGQRPDPPVSGFFVRPVSDGLQSEVPLLREMREAVFISIGGAAHDADKTLTALSTTIQLARRYHPEILSLALGTQTVDAALEEIDAQNMALLELVRELRARIAQMRNVQAETMEDLQTLLLAGGYVERIFSRLAKVRLFLGRVSRRMGPIFSEPGTESVRAAALELFQRIGGGIDFTKLAASMFRGLIEMKRIYEASQDPEIVNPHAYLRPVMLQSVVGNNIPIDLSGLAPDPWEVRGPHVRIWQIAVNLASNARQAMGDFGALAISSENVRLTEEDDLAHHYMSRSAAPGDYVALRVRDTGPGIPAEKLSQIFGLYHSGANSSGYGLAVTWVLVHQMGGFIGVDSWTEGESRGTTFSIYLPRA